MNFDTVIMKNAVVFSLLVSGASFLGLYTRADSIFSAAVFTLAVLTAVFFAMVLCKEVSRHALYLKGNAKIPAAVTVLFSLIGFATCIFLYAAFTQELSQTLPIISGEFEGGRFSAFFAVISVILALYMGKREMTSISRICFLLLPVVLLPYLLTFFDFVGNAPDISQLLPEGGIEFDIGYVLHPICAFGGIIAVFPLLNGESGAHIPKSRGTRGFVWAFLFSLVFCFFEYAKYIVWFGSEGVRYVERPDRTMLSQVPFMNVQELHLVSYYTAYMLKISLFCTCARKYSEAILKKLGAKDVTAVRAAYFATGAFAIAAYAIFKVFEKSFSPMRFVPCAVIAIFAVIILHGLLKTALKRYFAAKTSPMPHERT